MFRDLVQALANEQADDVTLFAGGTIPPEDADVLLGLGVTRVFGPGTPIADAVAAFDAVVRG